MKVGVILGSCIFSVYKRKSRAASTLEENFPFEDEGSFPEVLH